MVLHEQQPAESFDRGPSFGYHPNASKTYLVVKEEHEQQAKEVFTDTCINITMSGKRHLGAALGSKTFIQRIQFKDGRRKSLTLQRWLCPNHMLHMQHIPTASPAVGHTCSEQSQILKISFSYWKLQYTNISFQL